MGKRILLIVGVVVLVCVVAFYSFRNQVLNSYASARVERFVEGKNVTVGYSGLKFNGLTGVEVHNIIVSCRNKPPLFSAAHLSMSVRMLALLRGKVSIENIVVDSANIHVIRRQDFNNYREFYSDKSEQTDSVQSGYGEIAYALVKKLFRLLPKDLALPDAHIEVETDSIHVSCMGNAIMDEGLFKGSLIANDGVNESKWSIEGIIDKDEEVIDIKTLPLDAHFGFPVIKQKIAMYADFSAISFSMKDFNLDDDVFSCKVTGSVKDLSLWHKRIAVDTVLIPVADAQLHINIGKHKIVMDTLTSVNLGKLTLYPAGSYDVQKKIVSIKLSFDDEANDFFNALPSGLFSNLNGIKAKGRLKYSGEINFDKNEPDSVRFNSELSGSDFEITQYGKVDLRKMNGEFLYTAYDKGEAVRSFAVGPANPSFRQLSQISDNLKHAVMTSEDGNFYGHKGFNQEAFRQSIAENYKEKRFARGGSTISMQLVKNVFLSRNKTIARKLEEAIIVWLIENKRLSSKDRMLEVYFNVIEWGPRVYGAEEASQFYFSKPASDIDINEAIYLSMIVPRPKGFMYNFQGNGMLKPFANDYFRLMKKHLLRRNYITETDSISADLVKLNGPALNFIRKDSTYQDTIPQLEEEFEEIPFEIKE